MVWLGGAVEGRKEVFERGAGVVCEFLEDRLRLGLGEWAHLD